MTSSGSITFPGLNSPQVQARGSVQAMVINDTEITGIFQTGAIIRIEGDSNTGTIYAAVRTSGPYSPTDHSAVQSGAGAAWFKNGDNAYARSFVMSGLAPNTTYHWGTYRNAGAQTPVLTGSFVTLSVPAEPTDGKVPLIGA